MNTSEYVDTVIHQYSGSGEHIVQLVGYGCNGASDTLHFTISVPDIPDDTTYYAGDGTLLTFYPNPSISTHFGELSGVGSLSGGSIAFYVGKLPAEKVTFELVNELGQIVYDGVVPQGESTYIIPGQLAHGIYFGALRTETKRLETEKLMVK